uniref:Ig-like domain-containing protein n=1 Tax=Salvator merianae TaxID=96440 RepID=A0A8D0C4K4_SALMN
MGVLWWPLIYLEIVLLMLGGSSGQSSHSLTILYTLYSEPVPGLPQFVALAYVDDQLIGLFDSDTERAHPAVTWMEKVEKDTPNFWKWITVRTINSERKFRDDLKVLQGHYNQSGGFHTWQRRHGCEVGDNGYRGGFFQYAYDGRDLVNLDTENFTCEVADAKAQVLKRRWEADPAFMKSWKEFLEEECPDWLLKFVEYGNETLRRREVPLVKVTRRTIDEAQESLICKVHGFYPRETEATWRRDGEVWEHRTLRKSIAPNSDGTYYAWLSVDIDPTERNHFWCHVDHASLPEPLVLAWEEPASVSRRLRVIWILLAVSLVTVVVSVFWIQSSKSTVKESTDSYQSRTGPVILFRDC